MLSMLNKYSGIPLHSQLASLLREQIRSRKLPANAQLPSERELCDQFSISRITVRKALSTLLQEGLIYASVGKGTYVADTSLNEELQPLSSFTQDIQRRGMVASSQVLEATIISSDDLLASQFRIPRGAELVRLQRLRLADGAPVALQLSHLPHNLCPGILEYDLAERSLYNILSQEYGLLLLRADTEIEAALARPEEGRLLQVPLPAAVLISRQTTYLESGAIVEITRSVFRGDRYRLYTHR